VTFPDNLTLSETIEAGLLLGGLRFVATAELQVIAGDRLREFGVDYEANPGRGARPQALQNAARGRQESAALRDSNCEDSG
jgi:hypothetical protein